MASISNCPKCERPACLVEEWATGEQDCEDSCATELIKHYEVPDFKNAPALLTEEDLLAHAKKHGREPRRRLGWTMMACEDQEESCGWQRPFATDEEAIAWVRRQALF